MAGVGDMKIGIGTGICHAAGVSLSPLQKVLALFGASDAGAVCVPGIGSLTTAAGLVDEAGAGDPVGFQLDLSEGAGFSGGAFTGLGSEELTNGGFDTDSDWNKGAGWTIADGAASFDAASGAELYQTVGLSAGFYEISVTTTAFGCRVYFNSPGITTSVLLAAGENKVLLRHNGSYTRVTLLGTGGTSFSVSNVSIKEIPGYHAYQLVDAARPTRRASPAHLEDDGVDDALSWTAPADTYTVARVNSTGTVTIQTSQSLSGATDIMLETTIAGYLSINRSLTAGETTTLTAWLEGLAP